MTNNPDQPISDREVREIISFAILDGQNQIHDLKDGTATPDEVTERMFKSLDFHTAKAVKAIEAIVREARIDELNKAETIFKCEFGHDVIGHKTADGYCCACDADTNKQMFHSIERFHTTTGGLDTPTNENKENDDI